MAIKHGVTLAPVNEVADMLDDPQLAAREAWVRRRLDGREVQLPTRPVRIHAVDWSPVAVPLTGNER